MKVETSWKHRFLKKRLKYTLLIVVGVAVVFFIHQLFYYKELSKATVGKLISGSAQDQHLAVGTNQLKWNKPQHSKLIRNKDGLTVSLRGTRDQDISKYFPNENGKFTCITSKKEIDFLKINDNYCDCTVDGSDEPGTNACNNGVFFCEKVSKTTVKIPSYKVNDGYCDCCDGSDEWDEAYLLNKITVSNDLKQANKQVVINCFNTC